MLTGRLRLIELLDDLKLAGCPATIRVRVIPLFMESLLLPGAGVSARTVSSSSPGSTTTDPPQAPKPYLPMAESVLADGVTDADGVAQFTLSLDEAIARVSATPREGQMPVGVEFDQSFRGSIYGLEYPWTPPVAVTSPTGAAPEYLMVADVAKSIVGDTGPTHVTLWLQVHWHWDAGDRYRYVCELIDVDPPGGAVLGGTVMDPASHGGVLGGTSGGSATPPRPGGATHVRPGDVAGNLAGPARDGAPSGPLGGIAVEPDLIADVDDNLDLNLGPLRKRVLVDPARAMTGVVTFNHLRPHALYAYVFKLVSPDGAERVLTQGRFRTFEANPKRMNIAFASCHSPTDEASLGRWKALARRTDQDALFLIGDQIYADNIDKMFPEAQTWRDRYIRRYNQLFAYQPMRDAMRTRPTYMILDDHEIVDDWGTDPVDDRLGPGLEAYRIFQQAHNPGGYNAPTFDYHFRRGPAAFYFTDNRTARDMGSEYPVLGKAQHERLLAWAQSAEVADADLVIVVVPVPPGIVPVAAIEDFFSWAARGPAQVASTTAGAIAGAIIGGIAGFAFGGPGGALAGAQLGAYIGGGIGLAGGIGAGVYYEYYEDNVRDPDIRDAWTYDKNLPDLVRLLDVLFDVANDIGPDGRPGPKPKGVIVLSGDYHYGTIHRLISKRRNGRHNHGGNASMLQVTSSPISKVAENGEGMNFAIDNFASGTFNLDSKHYNARYLGRVMERNFGRVVFEHVGPGRRYHIQVYVEGETNTLAQMYELDLDKKPVIWRDMLGDVLAARGRISLLRVHDVGTGYGPPGDKLLAEVIVQLDTQPGRAFGFQLRKDTKRAANGAMLDLLRDAFIHDRVVTLDYKRTGLTNGLLIRAAVTGS